MNNINGGFGNYADEENRLLMLALEESLQVEEKEDSVGDDEADLQELLEQTYHAPKPQEKFQAPDPELAAALELSLTTEEPTEEIDPNDLDLQAILQESLKPAPRVQPAAAKAQPAVRRDPTRPAAHPAPMPRAMPAVQEKTEEELIEDALRLSLLQPAPVRLQPPTTQPLARPAPMPLQENMDPDLIEAIRLSRLAAPRPAPVAVPTPVQQGPKPIQLPRPAPKPRIETDLLKTTLANSTVSEESLNLAVAAAKTNPKLRIVSHQLGMNGVGNQFLVLNFASGIQRTMAIEELRSKFGMFQKDEPNRVGDTRLKLSVEQSIEFQNSF